MSDKCYEQIPAGYLECPVCNGTGHMPCTDEETRKYGLKNGWYGYRKEDDTVTCTNCGGQYQFRKPVGYVKPNLNGEACTHEYEGAGSRWRCCANYICKHCGDKHMIDSGD